LIIRRGEPPATAAGPDSLSSISASLGGLMNSLQAADVQPTAIQLAAIAAARTALSTVAGNGSG
jgi:hypothetical protein